MKLFRRPLVLPIVLVRWGTTILVVAALLLTALALYQGQKRDAQLCRFVKANRDAALADIREQAQTLIDQAVREEKAHGHIAEAARTRLVTGPAYVDAQVTAALRRRPLVNCNDL